MSCWRVDAEPGDCSALAGVVALVHAAVALVPWVAGCEAAGAVVLSVVCLGALPGALRAVPGRRCPLQALHHADRAWTATLRGGTTQPASVAPSTRVLPGIVLCRLRVHGQMLDFWLPRYAFPAGDFRRLKVALRCGQAAGAA